MNPLGPWVPDQPRIMPGQLSQAKNVTPQLQSYGPFKALSNGTTALSTRPYGGASFRDAQGTTHVFGAEAAALAELATDGTWTDLTRLSGAYNSSTTTTWRFAQFGDLCLATNFDDEVQTFTMSSGANFADLAGTPPRAKHITAFADFVVLGYTDTSTAEIRWCAINDPESWTKGTSQADAQILPDGGIVQGFSSGEVLYIFQQNRIRRMQYVGPPIIMDIQPITNGLGCIAPGSIADFGGGAAFLSNDGFYVLSGDSLQPIGANLVDQWFRDDMNSEYLYRMSSAADTHTKIIYWSYASTQAVAGVPDTILAYNWSSQRWSYARVDNEGVFRAYSLGYTLDSLDTLTTNIDNFDIPLDDPSLTGGNLTINGWGSAYQLGPFSGATLEAELITGDFEVHPKKRTYISAVEPFIDTTSVTVAVAPRETLGGTVTYQDAQPLEVNGQASADASGRFHRFKMTVTAGATWTDATGIDLEAQLDGET